jgi:hypothetical protein
VYNGGRHLSSPADFDNAILFQLHVEVWQNGELIDMGGIIRSHTDDAVKFEDGYFLKDVCDFRVR